MVWRLESERLLLRAPAAFDIAEIVTLAGDYDVAKNLSRMPHPYHEDDARNWIDRMAEARAKGSDYGFAIARKDDGAFMELRLETVIAGYFHDNPASGRVLEKLGCVADGAVQRDCLSRGHTVYCHNVVLTAGQFWKKKAA